MRKPIFLLIFVIALSVHCTASSDVPKDLFQVDELQKALPRDAEQYLSDQAPDQPTDFLSELLRIGKETISELLPPCKNVLHVSLQALVIVSICQLMTLSEVPFAKQTAAMTAAFGVMVCCGDQVADCFQLTRRAMDELTAFSNVLVPVIASISVSSGSPVHAAAMYSVCVAAINLLEWLCRTVAYPFLVGLLSFSMVDAILQQTQLKRFQQLLSGMLTKGLRILAYLFTGAITITSSITGVQDAAALKALRFSISASVPVVGGILSDAAETMLSGAAFLKMTVGTYGMLAVFAISILPFLQLSVLYLLMKLAAALSGLMDSNASPLLDTVACSIGFLMAVIGCCVYINLLTCVSLIRMTQF